MIVPSNVSCTVLVLCFVIALSFGSSGGEKKSKQPRAIVHIGPHKTGTTHVQAYLREHAVKMADKYGYYFPKDIVTGEYFDVKTAADFGHFLRGVAGKSTTTTVSATATTNPLVKRIMDTTSAMKTFLSDSVAKGRNVIFSVENLCTLDASQVQAFYELLTKEVGKHGFEVTIIATYREFLSHFRSHYAGISLNVEVPTAPFLQAIFKEASKAQFALNHIMATYAHYFGAHNMVLLDYYGMAAAQKDPAYVILCDVAKVMCSEAAVLNKQAKHENASKNWLPRQLLDVFKTHVAANKGCELPVAAQSEVLTIFRRNLTAVNARKPPYQKVMLEPLHTQSNNYDAVLRSRWGKVMLYGNVTANREAQKAVDVEELMYWRIYGDQYWRQWLQAQFEDLRSKHMVVNCACDA